MKRRQYLQAAGLAAAATAVARPAIAQSTPALKWRLTTSFPKSLDTIYGAAEAFATAVAEASDNRFQIQVFVAGEDRGGSARRIDEELCAIIGPKIPRTFHRRHGLPALTASLASIPPPPAVGAARCG